METFQEDLKTSFELIKNSESQENVELGIQKLREIYHKILGNDYMSRLETLPTFLAHGKAVSPRVAAECLNDTFRTAFFQKGVYAAVGDKINTISGRPVEILYAGCGPLAPLVLPLQLLPQTQREQINITLLDIHRQSIHIAREVTNALGMEHMVNRNVICENACSMNLSAHRISPPDIVISETIDRAMLTEPYAGILYNLSRQMDPAGIMIPQNIRLELYLASTAWWNNVTAQMFHGRPDLINEEKMKYTQKIRKKNMNISSTLFKKDLGVFKNFSLTEARDSSSLGDFSKIGTNISLPDLTEAMILAIKTTIQVWNDMILDETASHITHPESVAVYGPADSGKEITLSYEAGGQAIKVYS